MSILVPSNQNVQNKIRNDSFSGLEMRMNCHDWFQCWRENERQSLRVKIIIDLLPHTIHQIQDTDTQHTACVLMVHIWILFTRHNRGDGERKQTFKNKLLHFNFVTFLWPGKPWQKLHVFLRETGQKKTQVHMKTGAETLFTSWSLCFWPFWECLS